MRRRYALAIAAQTGSYLFILLCVLAFLGALPSLSQLGFILLGLLFMPFGIIPIFLKCERCGENYFYDEATARKHGSFAFHRGYNLLKPVKRACRKCGLNRLMTSDRDPV